MPELVRVDVGEAGGGAGFVDQPGDGVPVQRAAVLAGQQQRVVGGDVGGAVVADEGDQVRVQRQVPVVVQLADRDVEPVSGADEHDRVGGKRGELADAQSGAQQHLHHDADQHPRFGLSGAQQLGRGGVVEGFGQRVVLAGQVAGDDRHPVGCVGPVPLADAHEEHPQGAQPVRQRRGSEPGRGAAGADRKPADEVLDVATVDVRHGANLWCVFGQERGQ